MEFSLNPSGNKKLGKKALLFKYFISGDEQVIRWNEFADTDQMRGLPHKNIPAYINSLRKSLHLPSKNLVDKVCETIFNLAHDCDSRGLSSTISGDIDEKTAIYALLHCVRESDGTLTVTYTIRTLTVLVARQNIQPGIRAETGVQRSLQLASIVESSIQELQRRGVELNSSKFIRP